MAQFHALNLGFALAEQLRDLIAHIRQHDPDLAVQIRRAGGSVASNLSEGAQRIGKDRLQLYRISAGSAAEIRTQLRLAVAWGYVGEHEAEPVIALADRVVAITCRLTHPRA